MADGLSFDAAQAAAQRMAWLGASGSGKSYGCGRYVEQLHEAHVPVVVVDTVGIWPALRLHADGKKPGLPFVIIGGEHADVPLDLAGGKKLARFLVEQNASAVIDVSDHPPDERAPFLADLCEETLIAIKTHRRPRVFVFDEAQDIAPEKPARGEARMLKAVSALIRKGRNHLCGTVLLSQRPQDVSKTALNQTGNLFVGALFGKHERDAVRDWAGSKARSTLVDSQIKGLPELQPGEFFFWSPQWLKTYQRIQVLAKWTYDGSSSTPLTNAAKLDELAPVDVKALRALLKPQVIEQASDPTSPAGRRAAAPPGSPGPAVHRTDAPNGAPLMLQAEAEGLRRKVKELETTLMETRQDLIDQTYAVGHLLDSLEEAITGYRNQGIVQATALYATALESTNVPPAARLKGVTGPASQAVASQAAASQAAASQAPSSALDKPGRAILTVLAWQKGPISRTRLALLAGYSGKGGAFGNALSRLRTAGLLTGLGDLGITPAGRAAIGRVPMPPTGERLFEWWLSHPKVDKPMRLILATLHKAQRPLEADVLAVRAGYKPKTGAFGNALSRLRTLGLVSGKGRQPITLAEDLKATP
jgi:uncharacterized protein